ncbi:MAG: hypothetical protein BJ554DRAFT_4739, partial [Olpidium bornovanus]
VGQQRNAGSASAGGYPSRSKAVLQPGKGQGGVRKDKGTVGHANRQDPVGSSYHSEYSVNKEARTSVNALSSVAPDDTDLEQDKNRRERRHNSRPMRCKNKNAHESTTSDGSHSNSEDEAERRHC